MKKRISSYKKKKNKTVTIAVKIPLEQHSFIKENDLNPDALLQKAIRLEKQKRLQELQQTRRKKFDNEFRKIMPRVDEYLANKRKNDPLWKMRYKHARALTMSKFISYGGPLGDKLYDRFINNYNLLLKEGKK